MSATSFPWVSAVAAFVGVGLGAWTDSPVDYGAGSWKGK